MTLELRDCKFYGHALPEPFARGDLENVLADEKLLPKAVGPDAKALDAFWEVYRRKLRALGDTSGAIRVGSHVLEPLLNQLGYARFQKDEDVVTREGLERGGWVFETEDGKAKLRTWTLDSGADFDAPQRRGHAYRYSPMQIAGRVLFAKGERIGLVTDGTELRILFCDPTRRESHVSVELGRAGGWRGVRSAPDSFRLFLALTRPPGVAYVPRLVETARLQQTRVTDTLREQAKRAVRDFVQLLLDEPQNKSFFEVYSDQQELAKALFKDALVVVYRLLFILKLEASTDPERSFSFASTSLWRNTYSPTFALARAVKIHLEGGETGNLVSEGLRNLFRMFREGFTWSEMKVTKLGGMLFGEGTAPILDDPTLFWSERSVVKLFDHLLWTPRGKKAERERVHYGPLYVEDLGRVYEALLELSPGIATEPMCRLRRAKLEVVVPAIQGESYKKAAETSPLKELSGSAQTGGAAPPEEEEEEGEEDDEKPSKGKTKVEWIEAIAEGQFYLRVGLGRKATGSYYTPHAFVKFLIQETLGPQMDVRSPKENPDPRAILQLKLLDPAMGSGHFLVEACRTLGDALYEACRACDTLAEEADRRAANAETEEQRGAWQAKAFEWRKRVVDLPDPNDELVAYLPSRASGGETDVRSQNKALAICRRLAAVHCLYGVDKNPLAVELAKLALWLESYAEGLPLTFLDHRLLCGDSLTGPFFEKLLTLPSKEGKPLETLFTQHVTENLTRTLSEALIHVRDLEASIGKDEADIVQKRAAKEKLDRALLPYKMLGAAWSGAVMLGQSLEDEYPVLAKVVGEGGDVEGLIQQRPALAKAVEVGKEGVCYDLVFPEVFWPNGRYSARGRAGFHAVVGNPPWDALQPLAKEFYASFDLRILEAATRLERASVEKRLNADSEIAQAYAEYVRGFESTKLFLDRNYLHVNRLLEGGTSGAVTDLWQPFAERAAVVLRMGGNVGMVFPSAFHANQSATGVRELFLRQLKMTNCFSFENRNKLFEIDSRFKFALVTASRTTVSTDAFQCAFYLHDLEWLFAQSGALTFKRSFVEKTSSQYLSMLELRSPVDAEVASTCFEGADSMNAVRERFHLRFGEEMHMSKAAKFFTPISALVTGSQDPREPRVGRELLARGYVPLHEGKTFHQYTDRWEDRPRYLVSLSAVADKPSWRRAAQYFRLALRNIASSTNERTAIAAFIPGGALFGHSAAAEKEPDARSDAVAAIFLACVNTYVFDWNLRQRSGANVSLFILDACPVPPSAFTLPLSLFLAHSALRLTCNHEGYLPLWQEQLGPETWREPTPKHTFPILQTLDSRWALRAAIDAVIAQAYGLATKQYTHVLSSFSHKSYPNAPTLCLAAFHELQTLGLETFLKKYDPYSNIPLVTTLPTPVLDLLTPHPTDPTTLPTDRAAPSTHPTSPTSNPDSTDSTRAVSTPDAAAAPSAQLSLIPGETPKKRTRKKT